MGAASEVEIASRYINVQDRVETRITLLVIRYLQLLTLLELDNTMAYSILTKQLLPRRFKAINM